MKKENIPQDDRSFKNFTREVCYAVDEKGNYVTALSAGWEVKANALDVAWEDIEKRIAVAKQKVENKEASALLFFMEYRLMDIQLLADYTGFWKWTIKKHLKPGVFEKLSAKKLQKYADAFNLSVEDLKAMRIR